MRAILFVLFVSFVVAVDLAAQNLPRVTSNPDPEYPSEASELGFGGTVKLSIKIDKKGKVKVLQAWGPNAPCSNLDDDRVKRIRESVIAAASKVEFEPPMKDEKPTELEAAISYSFDSSGKPSNRGTADGSTGRIIEAGVLMGRVKHLSKPDYPPSARANRLSGSIPVSVVVGQ